MQREQVTSSNIASIGHDDGSNILEVEFKNGSVYQYYNVPKNEYDAMMDAESHGRYLNSTIKPKYEYKQIE